MLKIGFSF